MAQSFSYYQNIADRMIENDKGRDRAFANYQRMRRNEYDLPDKVAAVQGVRKVTDTGPSDAIGKGVQVMASRPPRLTLMPAINTPEGRARANRIERILKWQLTNANRRRPVSVVSDVFESAFLYGAVALNVMDLDHQLQVVDDETLQSKLKRARKNGRFVINTFNPMDVHMRRSSLGLECVLLRQERPAYDVIAEYPWAGKQLKSLAESGKPVQLFHYTDYESSCIWVQAKGMDKKVIMPPTNHDLPFLYWVAMMGGTTLDSSEEHKYRSILYSIYRSGGWETKNVVDTLMVSDVIWKALSPVVMVQNATEEVSYDTGDPGQRVLQLPYGASGAPLPPQQVDPALYTISQEFKNRMEESTISALLGSGGAGANASFAALNLETQKALGGMKPAKELTEKALAEMFTIMLLWTSYTGIDLVGSVDAVRNAMYSEEYTLPADEIDDENIYITVELDPDEPTDKLQRANTATLLKQLGYSDTSSLEDMGVEDPEQEIQRSFEEQLDKNMLDLYIQSQQMELQNKMQMMMIQFQNMIGQQQQQQQIGMQEQIRQQQEAQDIARQQELGGAIPGGPGFNPNMGGQAPANAAPGLTRENVTGQMGIGGEEV